MSSTSVRLHDRTLVVIRAVWIAVMAVATGALVTYVLVKLARGDDLDALGQLVFAPSLAAAAYIAWRLPRVSIGWLMLAMVTALCLVGTCGDLPDFRAGASPWLAWVAACSIAVSTALAPAVLLAYPDGHLPSTRWRPVRAMLVVGGILLVVTVSLGEWPEDSSIGGVANPAAVALFAPASATLYALGLGLVVLSTIGSLVALAAKARHEPARARVTVVVIVAVAMVALAVALAAFLAGQELGWDSSLRDLLLGALLCLLPLAIAIAIAHQRLYDVERLFQRRTVVGACVLLAGLLLTVSMLMFDAVWPEQGRRLGLVLASAVIAVCWSPATNRLARLAERGLLGRRLTAQQAFTAQARDLAKPAGAETVIAQLEINVQHVLGADEVRFMRGAPPTSGDSTVVLSSTFDGECLGHLVIRSRNGGAPSPRDREAAEALANQAALALAALTARDAARRSRQQATLQREEERRNLRRAVHDELTPSLAALTYGTEALATVSPGADAALLDDLRAAAAAATAAVRDLARGLRPPMLDELGLVGVIRAQAGRILGDHVLFEITADPVDGLPAAVEIAGYRIAVEALTNVARHAGATRVVVGLERSPCWLRLVVDDDGRGFGNASASGVGVVSMRERAEELGGRCVLGSSPIGGGRVDATFALVAP